MTDRSTGKLEATGWQRSYYRLIEINRRRLLLLGSLLVVLLILVWAALPALRAYSLVANGRSGAAPDSSKSGLPLEEVHFAASDGVHLAGWLARKAPEAATMILVHGFKGVRADMLPWADFLFAAGYNVLLFDDRGCGESAGWGIALGTREAEDVRGAVHYLQQRSDIVSKRFGALGISLGAGIVLLAAAREPGLAATVADSAWVDERAQLGRMDRIGVLPVLPYEPALVDAWTGGKLESTQPLAEIGRIAPRAVLLIHAADDQNTTTPLTGERQLYRAAGEPKEEWIAPSGGHVGALKAHKAEYEQRVLAFLARHLQS